MGILKTVELVDFAEKNAKRITNSENGRVGKLGREKCQKNGNGMLKNENLNVVVRPSELKPLCCNVLSLWQLQEKRICEVSLFFSNVFENFHSRNNALCDLSKVCQLRSKGFQSLGSLPFTEKPKRIRQKSLRNLLKTE